MENYDDLQLRADEGVQRAAELVREIERDQRSGEQQERAMIIGLAIGFALIMVFVIVVGAATGNTP